LDSLGITKLGHKKKIMMEIRGNNAGIDSSKSESQNAKGKADSVLTSSSDAPDVISVKAIMGSPSRYNYND